MSARALANRIPAGGKVDWGQLEWAAFDGRTAALDGKTRGGPSRRLAWQIPVVIIAAFFAVTPIAGFVILSDGGRFATAARDSDPAKTIPWAGVFFACAAVALIALIVMWMVTKKPMGARGFGFYTAFFAVISLIGITRLGQEQGVDDYRVWSIPVWIAAVLGGILGVLFIAAGVRNLVRGARGASADATVAPIPPATLVLLQQRRERIAGLSEEERSAVRDDIAAAVQELLARGLVTSREAERAQAAELGGLEVEMKYGPRTIA